MINKELQIRVLTSIFLILILFLMYSYTYILIISLLSILIITWIEFNGLIFRIFKKKNYKNNITIFLFKIFSLIYLSFITYIFIKSRLDSSAQEIYIYFTLLVSINSDIGGLIFGKLFKGRKLTKISPNKTISGSVGSFLFALFLIPLFFDQFNSYNIIQIILFTLLISLISQIGDLLVSFLKRKAKVKDTGDLLPGHGGFLDRIDGIIFAIPVGYIIFILI